jgi:hypothetical protein
VRWPRRAQIRKPRGSLAQDFASSILAAIRSASVEDLLEGRRGGGRAAAAVAAPPKFGAPPKKVAKGRLPRRSAEDIAKTLDRVVGVVKKSKSGMRAEDIRKALSLDVREMPRVLKEGLEKKKLRATGQKRATTYFAR